MATALNLKDDQKAMEVNYALTAKDKNLPPLLVYCENFLEVEIIIIKIKLKITDSLCIMIPSTECSAPRNKILYRS